MAFIDVNVKVLNEVSHEIETLDDALEHTYFPQMATTIYNLISNDSGIKSESIKSTLKLTNDKMGIIYKEIINDLAKLEEQIATALSEYQVNSEAALEKLTALFSAMQGFNENGTFDFAASDAIDYMEERPEEITAEQAATNLKGDFISYLENKEDGMRALRDFNDEIDKDKSIRDLDPYYEGYVNQYNETLNGETKDLLSEFRSDYYEYVYDQSQTLYTGNVNPNITINDFLESAAGAKWASYAPTENYVRDYPSVLSSSDAALTDYIYTRTVESPTREYLFSSDVNSYLTVLKQDAVRALNNDVTNYFVNTHASLDARFGADSN